MTFATPLTSHNARLLHDTWIAILMYYVIEDLFVARRSLPRAGVLKSKVAVGGHLLLANAESRAAGGGGGIVFEYALNRRSAVSVSAIREKFVDLKTETGRFARPRSRNYKV